jgi:hypothetical protein
MPLSVFLLLTATFEAKFLHAHTLLVPKSRNREGRQVRWSLAFNPNTNTPTIARDEPLDTPR